MSSLFGPRKYNVHSCVESTTAAGAPDPFLFKAKAIDPYTIGRDTTVSSNRDASGGGGMDGAVPDKGETAPPTKGREAADDVAMVLRE